MKALARAHFYWPGMSGDFEREVRASAHCAQHVQRLVRVPLAPWSEPGRPRVRIHLDYAEPQKGNAFLVAVNACSKYVDATIMNPVTSHGLATYLTTLSRHFGASETEVTDSGRKFISADFAQLCQDYRITLLRWSPCAPQGNELAENMLSTL